MGPGSYLLEVLGDRVGLAVGVPEIALEVQRIAVGKVEERRLDQPLERHEAVVTGRRHR
jgi:hypothetical protein